MIKAVARTEGGRVVVILGLSRRNCELLLADQPILIDLEAQLQLAGGGFVLLCAGETEAALQEQLQTGFEGIPK